MSDTLTYGDRFTIPTIPGITWRIEDRRHLESAGDPAESRAVAVPVTRSPRPDRYSSHPEFDAEGWRTLTHSESVKIGRIERSGSGLEISFAYRTARQDVTVTGEGYHLVGSMSGLTSAANKALQEGLAPLLPQIVLPPLSPGEVRARMLDRARSIGHGAARKVAEGMPDRFNRQSGHGHGAGRPAILAAMGSEPEWWDEFAAVLLEAFEESAREDIDHYRKG